MSYCLIVWLPAYAYWCGALVKRLLAYTTYCMLTPFSSTHPIPSSSLLTHSPTPPPLLLPSTHLPHFTLHLHPQVLAAYVRQRGDNICSDRLSQSMDKPASSNMQSLFV